MPVVQEKKLVCSYSQASVILILICVKLAEHGHGAGGTDRSEPTTVFHLQMNLIWFLYSSRLYSPIDLDLVYPSPILCFTEGTSEW